MGLWLQYVLRRGHRGIGIKVGANNTIVDLVANSQAAIDGVAWVGDIIVAVDGLNSAGS